MELIKFKILKNLDEFSFSLYIKNILVIDDSDLSKILIIIAKIIWIYDFDQYEISLCHDNKVIFTDINIEYLLEKDIRSLIDLVPNWEKLEESLIYSE